MKALQIVSIGLFVSVAGFISYNLIKDAQQKYYVVTRTEPAMIEDKLHLSGFVYPRKEIEIKPQLSGVVDELFVSVGDMVAEGAPIASVSLVPNSSEVETLTSTVRVAMINLNTAKAIFERQKYLYEKKAISRSDYELAEKEYLTAKENLSSAETQLALRQKGRRTGNNIVRASTSGTIIDIPVKPGSSVVERSGYNPGTTIAIVSSSDQFIFKGNVPERSIKDIRIGNLAKLSLLAYDSVPIDAAITMISAKGEIIGGAVKFPIEAEFSLAGQDVELRSGYSATAEILLSFKDAKMTLPERCVNFKGDTTYVYVTDSLKKKVDTRSVLLGLSDGERVEIVSGLSADEYVITNYYD